MARENTAFLRRAGRRSRENAGFRRKTCESTGLLRPGGRNWHPRTAHFRIPPQILRVFSVEVRPGVTPAFTHFAKGPCTASDMACAGGSPRRGFAPGKRVIFAWWGARHRGKRKKSKSGSLFSRGAAAPPVRKWRVFTCDPHSGPRMAKTPCFRWCLAAQKSRVFTCGKRTPRKTPYFHVPTHPWFSVRSWRAGCSGGGENAVFLRSEALGGIRA